MKCWCGNTRPYHSDEHHTSCAGTGILHCYCGGDSCVCCNHGEVQCPGCADCEDPDELCPVDDDEPAEVDERAQLDDELDD